MALQRELNKFLQRRKTNINKFSVVTGLSSQIVRKVAQGTSLDPQCFTVEQIAHHLGLELKLVPKQARKPKGPKKSEPIQ